MWNQSILGQEDTYSGPENLWWQEYPSVKKIKDKEYPSVKKVKDNGVPFSMEQVKG